MQKRRWYKANKDWSNPKRNAVCRERYKSDPVYRLKRLASCAALCFCAGFTHAQTANIATMTAPTANVATATVGPAGGACNTLKDAEDTDALDSDASFDSHTATAMIAGSSYNLCRVDVNVARSANATNDFFVEIRDVTLNSVLGTSATNANATVAAGQENRGWETFIFSTPVALSSGTSYWIDIRRTTSDYQLYWGYDTDAAIEFMITGDGDTWTTNFTTAANMFRTYSQ